MSQRRRIEIVDYDPRWPVLFEQLRKALRETLGQSAIAIEHVGGTSVPGLAAKAIIDVDVVIETRQQLNDVIRLLEGVGYQHQGDLGITGREAFKREGNDVPRGSDRQWPAHHLYVCVQDSDELGRHVAFRNYLRSHREIALEYARIKRALARRYPYDITRYIAGKGAFVSEILARGGYGQ